MRFVLFRRNLLRARIVRRRPIKTQQGNSRQRGTSAVKTLQRCEGALWFHFLFQRYFPAICFACCRAVSCFAPRARNSGASARCTWSATVAFHRSYQNHRKRRELVEILSCKTAYVSMIGAGGAWSFFPSGGSLISARIAKCEWHGLGPPSALYMWQVVFFLTANKYLTRSCAKRRCMLTWKSMECAAQENGIIFAFFKPSSTNLSIFRKFRRFLTPTHLSTLRSSNCLTISSCWPQAK